MRRLAGLAAVWVMTALPLSAADLNVLEGSAAVGVFGLDVTVGSTCSSPDEVTLEAPPATIDGDFEACRLLTAVGVEVGTAARFVAGDSVVLGEGFSVADGATLSVTIDSLMPSRFALVTTESPIAEQTFNARFHLRLDSLSLAEGEEVDHFHALAADGTDLFRLLLRRQSGQNLLVLGARQDGGGEILTPAGQEVGLPAGWNLVELNWRAGAGDGQLMVSVNQAAFVGLADLTNGLAAVERFRWGAVDGSFSGTPGHLEVDGFRAWR
jgi:hypothetical protein